MLTPAAILPDDWRSLPSWDLIDMRRELRLASKEFEERNELLDAAMMHRALADLDEFLVGLIARAPTPEEWAEACGTPLRLTWTSERAASVRDRILNAA